jgi:hypothetical protein
VRQDTKILFATVSALSDVSDPCPKRAASFARLQNSSAERERVDAEILNGSFEGELFIKKNRAKRARVVQCGGLWPLKRQQIALGGTSHAITQRFRKIMRNNFFINT